MFLAVLGGVIRELPGEVPFALSAADGTQSFQSQDRVSEDPGPRPGGAVPSPGGSTCKSLRWAPCFVSARSSAAVAQVARAGGSQS